MCKFLFMRVLLPAVLLSQLAAAQAARTVFLIRNADQSLPGSDSALAASGQKRAVCLADMLKDAGVTQIYVTDAKSTQETAAKLAALLKITPIVVTAKDPNVLIRNVLYSTGGNTLVVAPSETLSFVLARMKAGNVSSMGQNEYDRMFITTILDGSATPASTIRYCQYTALQPSPKPGSTPTKGVVNKKKP